MAARTIVVVLAGLSGLAGFAGAGVAQDAKGKVFMPWQKPQPQANPNFKELLPWLMGEEAAAKAVNADPASWDTELSVPLEPKEPVVPEFQPSRVETGAITPSGLVLKKPVAAPLLTPVAAKSETPSPANTAAEPQTSEPDASAVHEPVSAAPLPTTAAAGAKVLNPNAGVATSAASTASDGDAPHVPQTAAMPAHPPAPATAATPVTAQAPPTAHAPGNATKPAAFEAAAAMPQAEEAPPIPDPLPEAVVTPVAKPAAVLPAAASTPVALTGGGGDKPPVPKKLTGNANVAQQYCFNIADAAKDARYAWQKKTLADIEQELQKRIALLDERTAEYQKWLARRDEFVRNAEDGVVKIYTGMKPDTAAVQIALMHEESAAALLSRLNTRNASAILNEMDPAKAAKLTSIITGAAKLARRKKREEAASEASKVEGAAEPAAAGGAPPAAEGDGRS